ncbi:MAG: Ig-like domain-containing protein, partial [Solirubrobacterales bacterium]
SAPVISSPTDGSSTNDSTPAISGTAEPDSTVTVYVDGSPIGTTTTDGSGDWSFTPTTSIGDGTYDLTAIAEDAAGNNSAASASIELTIDSSAPNTSITDPPGTLTTSTSATFEFAADEPADRFECSLNGATFTTCTSTMNLTSLADGNYTIQVRAVDLSGNTDSTPASHSWTVDTTPPAGNVVEQTGTGGNGVPPTFTISSDDPGATQTCAINGGTPVACSSPYTPSGLAPGNYSMLVTFTDEAGNSSTRSLNFVVTAPVVTPPPPAATPTPPPPPNVTPEESDPLPAACFPKGITIYNLKIVGRKLRIQGFARSQYIGQKVTINYRPTKNKVIGKATVKGDGSFMATVKAPSKKLRRSGSTRYRANVGNENSLWFKLARRMGSSEATWKNGKLRVSGFLTKPLAPKATLTVNVRTGCNDPWKKVAVIKTSSRSGKFKANIPYEMTGNVVFVRMYAKVRRKPKSKKTLTTYSFSIPVVAQR